MLGIIAGWTRAVPIEYLKYTAASDERSFQQSHQISIRLCLQCSTGGCRTTLNICRELCVCLCKFQELYFCLLDVDFNSPVGVLSLVDSIARSTSGASLNVSTEDSVWSQGQGRVGYLVLTHALRAFILSLHSLTASASYTLGLAQSTQAYTVLQHAASFCGRERQQHQSVIDASSSRC